MNNYPTYSFPGKSIAVQKTAELAEAVEGIKPPLVLPDWDNKLLQYEMELVRQSSTEEPTLRLEDVVPDCSQSCWGRYLLGDKNAGNAVTDAFIRDNKATNTNSFFDDDICMYLKMALLTMVVFAIAGGLSKY